MTCAGWTGGRVSLRQGHNPGDSGFSLRRRRHRQYRLLVDGVLPLVVDSDRRHHNGHGGNGDCHRTALRPVDLPAGGMDDGVETRNQADAGNTAVSSTRLRGCR